MGIYAGADLDTSVDQTEVKSVSRGLVGGLCPCEVWLLWDKGGAEEQRRTAEKGLCFTPQKRGRL